MGIKINFKKLLSVLRTILDVIEFVMKKGT